MLLVCLSITTTNTICMAHCPPAASLLVPDNSCEGPRFAYLTGARTCCCSMSSKARRSQCACRRPSWVCSLACCAAAPPLAAASASLRALASASPCSQVSALGKLSRKKSLQTGTYLFTYIPGPASVQREWHGRKLRPMQAAATSPCAETMA